MDTTDPALGHPGPGVSFQQQRQLAFASGSATGTPAAASTPMEAKAQVSGPSIGQEIADLQSRAAQVDLSSAGEASTPATPAVQAPGGAPPDPAGAGAGAPGLQHTLSAPEQGAIGGGDFLPFDNSRSASYHPGQPINSPLNIVHNRSGNSGIINVGNETNLSRSLQCTHPNASRLCMESVKQELRSNNVSRRQHTPGPASSAASSSTQPGIRPISKLVWASVVLQLL